MPGKLEEYLLEKRRTIPLLPVRDIVLFPRMNLTLDVDGDESIHAVQEAMSKERLIFLVAERNEIDSERAEDQFYTFGTIALVTRMEKVDEEFLQISVQGLKKGRIERYLQYEPVYYVEVEEVEDLPFLEMTIEAEALMRNVREKIRRILPSRNIPQEVATFVDSIDDPGRLADLIIANLDLSVEEYQQSFETLDPVKRLAQADRLLNREIELSAMRSEIQSRAEAEMNKMQWEYFLRQQMRAIKEELGEGDEKSLEVQELKEKIEVAKMPLEVQTEAMKELERMGRMNPESPEVTVVRTYLDWLVELPWSQSTPDNLDIKEARTILDEDHYNLQKVKERILEYLSVRKLKQTLKGPILCFVGPPGVGKTSLGRSIARSVGRKFVRISLGGVHDEAEIRGHRRTYIGALPGRIIQGIRRAGSNNPVFMMDEVDKLGQDFRGDPTAALLEVLDPEQNNSFTDHYLGLPFDLSHVMFIVTANTLDPIPAPLRDRMEVIEISGYTEEEKRMVAEEFLIPKQRLEHGLTQAQLTFSKESLSHMITQYTREAGVRNLDREIATICRKVARKIVQGECEKSAIGIHDLRQYLGQPKYLPEPDLEESEVGVATGLVWTPLGGETLLVEVAILDGNGNLILTGHLGEVLKESAKAALSFIRAQAKSMKLKEVLFQKKDIHIHLPAGAVPKDGAASGITIATSLISALTATPVSRDVAMTGEITLRGKVLPVGGIKQKVLAALRAGIKTVILPEKNRHDLDEISKDLRKELQFVFVENMDEVLKVALRK
ncbi:MAG: endopeptidase La [Candidatus Tectomicrobia bacterium]|nr:endopeptidase La [Candidatus Tectomicrobia bacterium]